MTTLDDIRNYDTQWRSILENKGYSGMHFEMKYEPVNDEVRFDVWFYNTEWSSTHLPSDMKKCNHFEVSTLLKTIDNWVRKQPLEEAAREAKLLEDFAKIKERIDASALHDLIKAEVAAVMDRMTSNILEDKRIVQLATERADGEGEGQPT